MLCIACAKPGWPLCEACRRGLKITHDRSLAGVPVGVPFAHTATAARLVHNLKYKRSVAAGRFLAAAMASRVPVGVTALVPVRRSLSRRVAYGIDQASFLANAVGALVGVPVIDAVSPPLWWRRRAGAPLEERTAIAFRARQAVPRGAVLVDDVLTTGATVLSAAEALAPVRLSVLVATAAGRMVSGARVVPNRGGDVAKIRRATEARSPVVLSRLPEQSFERVVDFRAPVFESAYREEHG